MKNKKKLAGIVVIVAILFGSVTGCITTPPPNVGYLFPLEITSEQISNILGISITEIDEMRTNLNVQTYYVTGLHTAEDVFGDFRETYVDWIEHLDGALYLSDEINIYAGAWRQVIGINTVVVAEGPYILAETGWDCIVITSFGEITDYSEIFEGSLFSGDGDV